MPASNPSAFEIHSGLVMKGQLSTIKDVILTGRFEGELQSLGCLTVASGGVVTGSIDVGGLVLEPGNLVTARVKVKPRPQPKPDAAPAETLAAPPVSGWRRGIQRLKEITLKRR